MFHKKEPLIAFHFSADTSLFPPSATKRYLTYFGYNLAGSAALHLVCKSASQTQSVFLSPNVAGDAVISNLSAIFVITFFITTLI